MNDGANQERPIQGRADDALSRGGAGQRRFEQSLLASEPETTRVEIMLGLLRESEARFREFAEASSDALWIRDAETKHWEYLSPAFESVYGISREAALTGDHMLAWADLIVPEDRAQSLDCIFRACGGERISFEYRIVFPKDGKLRWLRSNVFPMPDEHGRVRRIGGIDRKSTRLNSSHSGESRMPSSA